MKLIGKLAMGAALAGGLAISAAAPADAGMSIGIGVGGPGYHHDWCYYHPYRCGGPGYGGGFVVGRFYEGRGWWDGRGWYAHRDWDGYHHGWRYRR